jgi:hypothetical protein
LGFDFGFYNAMGMAGMFDVGQRWSCGPALGWLLSFYNAMGLAVRHFINAGPRWSCGPAFHLWSE